MVQGDEDKEKSASLEQPAEYKRREAEWLRTGDYKGLYDAITDQANLQCDPCKQYHLFSRAVSTLFKMHETYTPRPTIFGIFIKPHRSNIRAINAEFQNERDRVQTSCLVKRLVSNKE